MKPFSNPNGTQRPGTRNAGTRSAYYTSTIKAQSRSIAHPKDVRTPSRSSPSRYRRTSTSLDSVGENETEVSERVAVARAQSTASLSDSREVRRKKKYIDLTISRVGKRGKEVVREIEEPVSWWDESSSESDEDDDGIEGDLGVRNGTRESLKRGFSFLGGNEQ